MVDKTEEGNDGSMFVGGIRVDAETVARIRKEAEKKAKDNLQRAAEKNLAAQLERAAMDELRKSVGVNKADEPLEDVVIDLPGYCADIKINGFSFFHNSIVKVPASVAVTVRDIMARAWEHERSVGGANKDAYARRRNTMVSGRTGAVANRPMVA